MIQTLEVPERRLNSRRFSFRIGIRRLSHGRRSLEITRFMDGLSEGWEAHVEARRYQVLHYFIGILMCLFLVGMVLASARMIRLRREASIHTNLFRQSSEALYSWAGFRRVAV